jgi:PPM family protein phosphatase
MRRTRDHSHVELLLREGLITAEQVQNHPMRNFVECCIGGDPILPDMSLGTRCSLQEGDTLLLCTDGLWGTLKDEEIANEVSSAKALRDTLTTLAKRAISRGGAGSDNTSAAALRWFK